MYIYFELHKGRSGSLYRDLLMVEREKKRVYSIEIEKEGMVVEAPE